jgi:nitrite reductase/ring-hydroxylating ferredoxin subunit
LAEDKRLICASADLAEAGRGYRFTVTYGQRESDAFVVRFRGRVFGYLNECGHVPAQLDWLPGEFFDDSKLYLVCSVHGALYAPDSGRCLGGRCQGKGLTTLAVDEVDGQVYLLQEIAHG